MITVLPFTRVGARRLPVGPRRCLASSALDGLSFFKLNSVTFFPLQTINRAALLTSFNPSANCNFLLAGIISALLILCDSRNSWVRPQLVQPGR